MSSILGNYLGNQALDKFFHSAVTWMALHSSDPGVNGTLATEFNGGGYARVKTTWSIPNNKTIATTNAQNFFDLHAATLAYLAVWDSAALGNILIRFALPDGGVAVPLSGYFTALPGDIAFSL